LACVMAASMGLACARPALSAGDLDTRPGVSTGDVGARHHLKAGDLEAGPWVRANDLDAGPRLRAEELDAVRVEVERALPQQALVSIAVPPPLVFRRSLTPVDLIYNQRVDGVVLLASTKSVATGVLVSGSGDIITNDHIVQHAQRVGADDWIAVWFRPSSPSQAAP